MPDGQDIMLLLPERLSICILELLDAESLFNCTEVSRDWNEITDRLQWRIWFEACVNAGIHVEEDKYQDAREWKAFFCSMVQRLRDMKVSDCYEIFYCPFQQQPRAVAYHNEKIAVAFSDYIEILDTSHDSEECVLRLPYCFETSFLKLVGNTLIAASTDGHTSCWFLGWDKVNHHNFHEKAFLSFDALAEYSIMVGSRRRNDSASIIYIWRISEERLFSTINVNDKIIHRVLLAPNPDSPAGGRDEITCFLFGLSEDCVRVWIVEIGSSSFGVQVSTSFIIPSDPNIHGYVADTMTFGFLFDGTELFIMTPSPERSPGIIWAWNFRKGTVRYLESCHPIVNLLGVGKKYLVYKLRCRDDTDDTVCAVDKITNEKVAGIRAPRIPASNSFISLGHSSWLDGLDGENDSGIVFVSIDEDTLTVDIVTFVRRC